MAADDVDVYLGETIRRLREVRGLSKARVGRAIGTTYQQVSKYEAGETRISASTLYRLAKLLDVKMSFFFDRLPDGGDAEAAELAETIARAEIEVPALLQDPEILCHVERLVRAIEKRR